jgi:hypothetical protein
MSFKPRMDPTPTNGHLADEPAYWWQNPDHPDEWYQIRPLWNEVQAQLFEKHQRPARRGQVELNRPAYYKALMDYLIADWELYEDEAGTTPVPCTIDHKFGLWRDSSERTDAIFEEARRLANNDAARREAERASFRPVGHAPAGSAQ